MRTKKQADFTPLKAKIAMLERGTNVSTIARKLNASRNAVSMAIHHGVFSPLREKIRKELGL